ncbi:MAG: AAA family ATPase, partial [Clostridia bacterium]|nr:AAA family ATPase [Clostridia bacterium]
MFIEKIAIESFGSLSSVSYDLTSGVNILRGNNESGKSTIAAFIKFIFYGLCGKLPDQSMTEKTRYTNWDHGISGGYLVVNDNGKRYRIERRVTPAAKAVGKEKIKIVDLESGAEVLKGVSPGEHFFGVSEDVFSQSAFSAQGSGSLVDAEKMNNAIDNILFSGSESVSVKTALKKLDEARVFLLHKNKKGGKLYAMDLEIDEVKTRVRQAEDNEAFLAVKNKTLAESRKQQEANRQKLQETSDKLKQIEACTVLARYDELDRKKEACQNALAACKATREQNEKNNFLPTREYRDALRACHADISIAEKETASIAMQKDALTTVTLTEKEAAILEAAKKIGGIDAAKKALTAAVQRKKSRQKLTALLFSGFSLSLVATLLFGIIGLIPNLPAPVGYGLFALSAVLLVFSLVSFVSLRRLHTKDMFDAFDAADLAEAIQNITQSAEAERLVREDERRHQHLNSAWNNCMAREKKLAEHASTLLSQWGRSYTDKNSLTIATEEASKAILALEAADQKARDAKLAYDSIASALSGFSREAYAAEKERTAYVGEVSVENINELKLQYKFCTQKESALTTQIRTLELEIASRAATTESSDGLKEALSELEATRREYEDKHQAYLLAYAAIKESGEHLRARIAPALSEKASELVKNATDGKYQTIGIDNSLKVSFRADETSPEREV